MRPPVLRVFVLGLFGVALMAAARSPFAGTWQVKMNGLPGVDLTIMDTDGKISGVIGFYFQVRGADGKWRVEGEKYAQPLLSPKAEGKNLTFEVVHHKSHGSPELGPNVKFRMELTGPNEAKLYLSGDNPEPAPLKLMRK